MDVAILRETITRTWPRRRKSFDLSDDQCANVKAGMHELRVRLGGWRPVAAATGYTFRGIRKAVETRHRPSITMAYRVACALGVPVEALISGVANPRCPLCGRTGEGA